MNENLDIDHTSMGYTFGGVVAKWMNIWKSEFHFLLESVLRSCTTDENELPKGEWTVHEL
jgi:hypothetical protein